MLVPTCFQICLMLHRNRYNLHCEFVSCTRINIVKGKREELRFGEREGKGFSNVTKDVVVEQHYRIHAHFQLQKKGWLVCLVSKKLIWIQELPGSD